MSMAMEALEDRRSTKRARGRKERRKLVKFCHKSNGGRIGEKQGEVVWALIPPKKPSFVWYFKKRWLESANVC